MSNKLPLLNGLEERITMNYQAIKAHSNNKEIRDDMAFFDAQYQEMLVMVRTLKDLEAIEGIAAGFTKIAIITSS